MVPPEPTSLVGAHMDQVLASDLYQKLMAQQKLPQLDQFARETGFDPRQDVRELLLASRPVRKTAAVGARQVQPEAGSRAWHETDPPWSVQHPDRQSDASGYCILDSTLAAAGEVPAIEAALDEWKHGSHKAPRSRC